MKRSFLLFILAGFLFAAASGWYWADLVLSYSDPATVTHIDERAMRAYAYIHGDQNMYAYYTNAAAQSNVTYAHEIMHQIGDVLYERRGISALAVCGNEFHSGCTHQVLGRELTGKGAGAFDSISSACDSMYQKDRGSCGHGLGHGLTYASGYKSASLESDLSKCDVMHKNDEMIDPGQSCYAGVFMEFNMHFMELRVGAPRIYDQNNPVFPCDMLTDNFHRQMCYYWLPPWLENTFYSQANSENDMYVSLGKFCDQVREPNFHQWCVLGIGRVIGLKLSKPAVAYTRCVTATSNQADLQACIRLVGEAYKLYKQDNNAKAICALDKQQHTDTCVTFSRLIENPKKN